MALVILAISALAVGCGSSNDSSSTSTPAASTPAAPAPAETTGQTATTGGETSASGTVKISADPSGQLKYEQSEVTAKAGKVEIEFDNPSPIPHDVVVEENGKNLFKTKVITKDSDSASGTLKAGTYTFYCSVPGHRQAGMEGKLVVQ